MQKVLTAEQMRTVDRLTTERYGIPSIILMENAAHAVARVITEKLGGSVKGKSILILCGKGNNGGDGAALARILNLAGALVEVVLLDKIKDTRGDARVNFGILCAEDFEFDDVYSSVFCELYEIETKEEWNEFQIGHWNEADIVVDAIFGTGLTRSLEIWLCNVVHELNFLGEDTETKPRLRVAIDIPSGLDADSGEQKDIAFQSDVTVTFTAPKPGNILPGACGFNGELVVANIGSDNRLIDEEPSQLYLAEQCDAANWLLETAFSNDSYKNKRGHALVIAGSESYSGAAVLAGNAAMRSGVGLVTIATPKSAKDSISSRLLPEVMVKGTAETYDGAIAEEAFEEIAYLFEKCDSVAIGSGLSQSESTRRIVRKVVENQRQPMIVDADALNLLSPFSAVSPPANAGGSDLILTPHEGEFMRLLGTDDKKVVKDRVAAVREFSVTHNVILVLKGERVLIGAPDGRVVVNPTGNSGLGKAGNGDTLAGILAGFVAQAVKFEIDIFKTVVAAVYVAGMAGDIAEKKFGKRVMTASDVRECLVDVFAELNAK